MSATREPLATYEQAINRLSFFEVAQGHTPEQLNLAVQIVADMFWFSDAKVRHDMQKATRALDVAVAPRRRRSVGAAGVWGH